MWSEFPLFGLGQGSFFKLSAIEDFSGSALMVASRGENAHNYFLQALAEVGLIGFACYAMVFIWPLATRSDKKNSIWPVGIAIGAMFLGNLYSHSLLIRENLFLLSALIALLYAKMPNRTGYQVTRPSSLNLILGICLIVLLVVCGGAEVITSFHKPPFAPVS
jgi:O-antigen ligase